MRILNVITWKNFTLNALRNLTRDLATEAYVVATVTFASAGAQFTTRKGPRKERQSIGPHKRPQAEYS